MPSIGRKKTIVKNRKFARSLPVSAVEPPVALWKFAAALFLLSAGALADEVLVTRLFSLVFQYHYAFLAVSLAILGLGIGGLLALVFREQLARSGLVETISWLLFWYALSLPVSALLFAQLPSSSSIVIHVLVGLIPFAIAGILSATLYAENSQQGAILYAADLLGSAAGLVLVNLLLGWMGAFQSTLILSVLLLLAALLLSSTSRLRITTGAGAILLVLGAALAGNANLDLPANLTDAPADKVMYHVLSDPSQSARLVDTAWSPFSRVDLVETADADQKFVFTDAGAGSFMVKFDGDLEKVAWLKQQPGYLPFAAGPLGRTLILGSGAGKDILQARLAGSPEITAVEINPAILDLTQKYANYNGNILNLSGVQSVLTDGRNFVERDRSLYDLIYLNLVYSQASEPGSAALAESYIFTEEAFRQYWNRLSDDGRIAIVSHQALEGSRAIMTAIGSLQSEGLKASDVLRRSVLVMQPNDDPNQRISVFILKKTPWTIPDLLEFRAGYESQGMQALYVPGVFEATMRGLTTDEISLDKFLSQDTEYNLSPTSDDRPFFFNLKPGLPGPLQSLAWIVGFATLAYLGMVLALNRSFAIRWDIQTLAAAELARQRRLRLAYYLSYFGLLGAGFMLIEVPLIQRAILLLGNPTLALAAVIGSLLLSAGLGSLLSSRIPQANLFKWVTVAGSLIAILAILAAFFQPALVRLLIPASLPVRTLAATLLLVPLGLPMGVPFASGLRLAGCEDKKMVPAFWGWNAITSVLGSVLATVIAVSAGFRWALVAGAVCYLVLCILAGFRAGRQIA